MCVHGVRGIHVNTLESQLHFPPSLRRADCPFLNLCLWPCLTHRLWFHLIPLVLSGNLAKPGRTAQGGPKPPDSWGGGPWSLAPGGSDQ